MKPEYRPKEPQPFNLVIAVVSHHVAPPVVPEVAPKYRVRQSTPPKGYGSSSWTYFAVNRGATALRVRELAEYPRFSEVIVAPGTAVEIGSADSYNLETHERGYEARYRLAVCEEGGDRVWVAAFGSGLPEVRDARDEWDPVLCCDVWAIRGQDWVKGGLGNELTAAWKSAGMFYPSD